MTLRSSIGVWGRAGSLGYNSAIEIDGLTPYITKVWTDASNECQFWLAGKCESGYRTLGEESLVYVKFSATVTISSQLALLLADPG